jgi:transcriptional regulator with GAF, ATPase, and Fis domain
LFLAAWQAIVAVGSYPPFILPGPLTVAERFVAAWARLAGVQEVTVAAFAPASIGDGIERWLSSRDFQTLAPATQTQRAQIARKIAGLRGHASITAGARLLGTSRRALRDSMKRHGVYRAEEPTA